MVCHRCGDRLQVISSVAADPHDAPVYYCPCWPTDWLDVAGPIIGLLVVFGVPLFIWWVLS